MLLYKCVYNDFLYDHPTGGLKSLQLKTTHGNYEEIITYLTKQVQYLEETQLSQIG